MNESRKTLIKIILIFVLISSFLSGNLFALILSAIALYGLATDDMGLLKIVLIPFIIELVFLILIAFGVFISIIIVLTTMDEDSKLIGSLILGVIFLFILMIIVFQIIVIVVIKRFINDTNESKKITNSSNTQNNIQNSNIYTNEPQSPALPPHIPMPQSPALPPRNPYESGTSANYSMPQPSANAASVYPVLPQVDNYEELPPPYMENPNIKVSDAKN